MKQNVAPLQADEVARIRKKCSQFEQEQLEFKEKQFRLKAPFKYNSSEPYPQIDEVKLISDNPIPGPILLVFDVIFMKSSLILLYNL